MAFVYTVKKGDTLNKIAQQYGFSNYKEAGVSSVPSGNFDLIREGEQVSLGNYDPNKVTGIKEGSPVVSSQDDAQGFRENSNELDRLLGSYNTGKDKTETNKDKNEYTVNDKGQVESSGDPVLDKLNAWETAQKVQYERETEKNKREYEKLYQTQLASIDATADATIQRINSSYEKRLDEQARINDLNIARVKAYGLGNGGQYTPISFGDAITNREKEASDKINSLENERNSLIAQADQARLQGQSALLADKMDAIFNINKQLRESLTKVEQEAEAQYKLLRTLREEEEAKHKENVDEMIQRLSALAPKFTDDYEQMSEDEKDAFLQKLAQQTGVDYATIYGIMQGSIASGAESALKTRKAEADILASQALAYQRNTAGNKNLRETGDDNTMSGDVPDTFVDDADFKKKQQEFVKKHGTKGKDYWDAIFYDDSVEEYSYETGGSSSGGGDVKSRAESAGYDYASMRAQGYSDEEIRQALDDAGV